MRVERRVEGALLAVAGEPEEGGEHGDALVRAIHLVVEEWNEEFVRRLLVVRLLAGPQAAERSDDDAGATRLVEAVHEERGRDEQPARGVVVEIDRSPERAQRVLRFHEAADGSEELPAVRAELLPVEDREERQIAGVGRLVIPPEPERHRALVAGGRQERVEERGEGGPRFAAREPQEGEEHGGGPLRA